MARRLSGRLISVSALQPRNAPLPISVTELPKTTLFNVVEFKNSCNIPDHTMTVTSMPELEKGLGEHMAIVEAEFCGEKNFTAKL